MDATPRRLNYHCRFEQVLVKTTKEAVLTAFCENATQRPKTTLQKSAMPIGRWQRARSILPNSPHFPLISGLNSLRLSRLSGKLTGAGKKPLRQHTERLVSLPHAKGGEEYNSFNAKFLW
jgi:hypothetical protein